MKKGIGEFIRFHLAPALVGAAAICVLMLFFSFYGYVWLKPINETNVISGQNERVRASFGNCEGGEQSEIDLGGALKTKKMLKILGSSELALDAYSPYFFLSDSLNLPTLGYGHAYHQSFSMYCGLLAMEEFIDGSKICIIVSPGWFATEGTNIEAFLEFVRPNFLKSIAHKADMADKLEVGRYVYAHIDQVDQPGPTLKYFSNLYMARKSRFLTSFVETVKDMTPSVTYDITERPIATTETIDVDWDKKGKMLQQEFVSKISNSIYVRDDYFKQYLQDEEGKVKVPAPTTLKSPNENRELADFKLLVALLKKHKVKASFIIQPLNPYYYNDLENYSEIISAVEQTIEQHNYPYFNMFVTKKEQYEPGTLRDIMHLGDYGWLKIDQFLWKEYGL